MNTSRKADLLGITEFISHYPITVIPLDLYCVVFGDTPEAVKKRISRGTWTMGKQAHRPKGQSKIWIDLKGVEQWVKQTSS